jgi:alanyl-tRNA synthetase
MILSETGIAAGVRRIEALTGKKAYDYMQRLRKEVGNIAGMLKAPEMDIAQRIDRLLKESRDQERNIKELKAKLAQKEIGGILDQVQVVEGIKVLTYHPSGQNMDMESLRGTADLIAEKLDSGIVALGTELKGKANILIKVSKDLTDTLNAPDLIRRIAGHVGGSGGGRPDMAQAGGNKPQGIDKALKSLPGAIQELLLTNKSVKGD